MNKEEFKQMVEEAVKPLRCRCGEEYKNDLKGGFVTNGETYLWCCCKNCANKTQEGLY